MERVCAAWDRWERLPCMERPLASRLSTLFQRMSTMQVAINSRRMLKRKAGRRIGAFVAWFRADNIRSASVAMEELDVRVAFWQRDCADPDVKVSGHCRCRCCSYIAIRNCACQLALSLLSKKNSGPCLDWPGLPRSSKRPCRFPFHSTLPPPPHCLVLARTAILVVMARPKWPVWPTSPMLSLFPLLFLQNFQGRRRSVRGPESSVLGFVDFVAGTAALMANYFITTS